MSSTTKDLNEPIGYCKLTHVAEHQAMHNKSSACVDWKEDVDEQSHMDPDEEFLFMRGVDPNG